MNATSSNVLAGKRRIVWFGLALLAIGSGLSWQINRSREPMYDGKPLTYWLERLQELDQAGARLTTPWQGPNRAAVRVATSWQEAEYAVQTIGTNAMPTLLDKLERKDSPFKSRLAVLLRKQSFIEVHWHWAEHDHLLALMGFEALGSNAAPAVPALMDFYQNNTNARTRPFCIFSLAAIGPQAKKAVPMLAASLVHRHDPCRDITLEAIGNIHSDAACSIPALTNCLSDPRYPVRMCAVDALRQFGSEARETVPELLMLLHDKEPAVRHAVHHALRQIDPKTAAQVE